MMIDFEAVLRHFWPKALRAIHDYHDYEVENDRKALRALCNKNLPASARMACLVKWFRSYAVFLGVTTPEGLRIAEAVLVWADERNPSRDLTTAKALADAHAELMKVVCQAYGKKHQFTSLASKALWLCYPESVPMFDSYGRNALSVICKMEMVLTPISEKRPEYEEFVHVWKQLYEMHKETIENLDIGAYSYRVRVFDRVLWLIGQRSFHTD
jgi:hypothetical protein